MQPDLQIIPAPAAHKECIAQRQRETYERHRRMQPYSFPKNLWESHLSQSLDKAFRNARGGRADHSSTIYVALLGGELAGYIQFSDWADDTPMAKQYVSIDDIHVIEKHRNKGVAQALLAHAKTLSEQKGWPNLTATVWASNDASYALFQRAGFVQNFSHFRYGPDDQIPDVPAPRRRSPMWRRMVPIALVGAAAFLAGRYGPDIWSGF